MLVFPLWNGINLTSVTKKQKPQVTKPAKMSSHGNKMTSDHFVNFESSQDYEKLKQQHLEARKLFEDQTFPIDSFFQLKLDQIKWKRPGEIVKKPKFFSSGAERFDVNQGNLGDCWLLAAVANLTLHKEYFDRVVPGKQTFDKEDYAGIFHFRFWHYGKWVEVVVDDRLPTEKGELVLMHSAENTEFWSALLEKAYAKLHGSYRALEGGHTTEAMEDFTGGLSEQYTIESDNCPANLFNILLTAYQRGSFIGCNIYGKSTMQRLDLISKGLYSGHAYSITSVKEVVSRLEGQKSEKSFQLVRIRNPWGNEQEWNGAWSDKSTEWASVTLADKKRLGLTRAPDGEFWMSFDDFKKYFDDIDVTHLSPYLLEDKVSTRRWEEKCYEGQWIYGVSAGGSRSFHKTFAMNPQYMVSLNDPDEEDDDELCTFVVSVMQEYNRKKGLRDLKIGFAIYQVKNFESSQPTPGAQLFDATFFRQSNFVVESKHIDRRGICERFRLKPGRYCIVPSTSEPHQERSFMIRYFSEIAIKSTRKNGTVYSSLTSNMQSLTLNRRIDLVDDKDKNSQFWNNFIWAKVDKDDEEYQFVRGEYDYTDTKPHECQYCLLWFSSTYFENHFKHCVFDNKREVEYERARQRWNAYGESVTKQVSFKKYPDPIKGFLYNCQASKCGKWTRDLESMEEHLQMEHNTEKPYRCTECANAGKVFKFSRSAYLEKHIKLVHMTIA